jgi:hypothetical protein
MSLLSNQTIPPDAEPARSTKPWLRLDLTTVVGVVLTILLLRSAYGFLFLFISSMMPQTPLEVQVSVIPGQAPFAEWLQRTLILPWLRYDAWNYQRIVEHGYRLSEGTAAFHPLYALLAWPVAALTTNGPFALLLVSTLATALLIAIFVRYVARFHSEPLAQPATWLLLLVPPSFILLAIYTESTFLVFAVGSVWAMNQRRWWLAALAGALATLTRQQGLALALPLGILLLLELWNQVQAERNLKGTGIPWRLILRGLTRTALISSLIPLAYGAFVIYRTIGLGEGTALNSADTPFQYLWSLLVSESAQHVAYGQRVAWPWEVLGDQLQLIQLYPQKYPLYIDLALGWGLAAIVLLGLPKMTLAERWYSIGILVLSFCYYNGELMPYMALPRHVMLAFPLYIVLARWLHQPRTYRYALQGFGLFNIFLAGAYARLAWIP